MDATTVERVTDRKTQPSETRLDPGNAIAQPIPWLGYTSPAGLA